MTTRVCLLDDHQIVCDSLTSFLEGHEDMLVVGQAIDGQHFLANLGKWSPDVAILDVSMPNMTGIEVAVRIRDKHPGVKVLMLSMHANQEHIRAALTAGARGYVLKESAGLDLVTAIRDVMAGRISLAHPVTESLVEDYLALNKASLSNKLAELSERERQVLTLQVEGHASREIAEALHISPKTVETYRYRIKEKLGIRDTVGLVKFAIRHGLTSAD